MVTGGDGRGVRGAGTGRMGICSLAIAANLLKTHGLMASTPVINLRKGHAVRYNNEVCLVSDFELKTPPRMASYVQMSVRALSTGKVYNLRMTSNESLESVNLTREPHEYSYKDGDDYHFMHPETFEDVVLMADQVKDAKNYLIEGQKYTVQFADDVVIGIELPPSVVMTVAEAPEGVKGDSANNVYKAAIMETGLQVQVPLFIGPGDKISVKTEDNSYLGRSN
jgi:elongation factor P